MAASTPRPCLTSWGFLVNSLRTLQASARLAAMAVESSRAIWPIDGLPKRSYAGVRRVSKNGPPRGPLDRHGRGRLDHRGPAGHRLAGLAGRHGGLWAGRPPPGPVLQSSTQHVVPALP